MSRIDIKNITFKYESETVLDDISFSVSEGDFLSIIGPNGAGKSTLLKIICRYLTAVEGEIEVAGKNLKDYAQKHLARIMGYVPQSFSAAFDYKTLEVVLMGRFPHQKLFGFDSQNDREIARMAMEKTDCWHLRKRTIDELSGGEKQRVVLASALAQEPDILLLDEPTTALDLKHQSHFYNILHQLSSEKNITIITVTHDINLAAQFSNRLVVLKKGKIIEDGSVAAILKKDLLETVYETKLTLVTPEHTAVPLVLPTIPGMKNAN